MSGATAKPNGKHLVLVLSDLHFGKGQEGNGRLEAYDLEIADERVRGIPTQLRGHDAPASLTVLLVGDLADGSGIYPYQDTMTDDANPLRQVAVCIGALWHMLCGLAEMWPDTKIFVRSVRGNHGRLHPSSHPQANWDNQIVFRLAELAMSQPQIDVVPHYGLSYVTPVGSIRIAMIHKAEKHATSGPMIKRVKRRLRHYKADILISAHWHTGQAFAPDETAQYYCNDGPLLYVLNGSLCGPDEYSEQMGLFDGPRQALITVPQLGPVGYDAVEWLEW